MPPRPESNKSIRENAVKFMPVYIDSAAHWTDAARRGGALFCLLGGLALATECLADIYKFVDRRGVMHFSDRPKGSGWKLVYRGGTRVAPLPEIRPKPRQRPSVNRSKFTPLINAMARRYRLDHDLLHAIVRAESSYNPNAISHKGAVGLMQLMPATAARYGVSDRYNPRENLAGGSRYLRDLLLQFRRVELALAAYNAGENAVIKYGHKIPPYPETQTYVRRVLRFYSENRRPSPS